MADNQEKPMLETEEKQFYEGEKEPESKPLLAGGDGEEKNNGRVEVNWSTVGQVPVVEGIVMGRPVEEVRQPWSTGLFCCLGNNDEYCSSDMQVCVLGTFAPCVLYGSNIERLRPEEASFTSHCLAYSSLYLMGSFLFNANCLAPCFSFPSRVALRRSHNLEGHGESLVKSVGCCSGLINSEEKRERLDAACDLAMHFCCHACSLCQEGREICRRTVHPAHRAHLYSLAPPSQQSMN